MEVIGILPFPRNINSKPKRPTGKFAHENHKETFYALDFPLPLNTPVMAINKGSVFIAKYDSDKLFLPSEIEHLSKKEISNIAKNYTNYVAIYHGNNIFTEYCHLSKKEVVKAGGFVSQGDILGYVGMTGITSEPHLHINAFIIEGKKVRSVPLRFV